MAGCEDLQLLGFSTAFFSFANELIGNHQFCPVIASRVLSIENVIAFFTLQSCSYHHNGRVDENQGQREGCHLRKSAPQLCLVPPAEMATL